VTTPRDRSIVVLDVSAAGSLTFRAKIPLDGAPEGFAVDDARGLFYTNLEDKNRTLTIDVHSRKVTRDWPADCGEKGPRGLALDRRSNFLLVACTDRVAVVDAGHDGRRLSMLAVGDGLDNIDYVEARHEVYAAAARAAQLTIAHLDEKGTLTTVATVASSAGARNAVATDEGTAYLTDSPRSQILVVAPEASH
jgi:DNA-binding beta-propeller fold protein YncE